MAATRYEIDYHGKFDSLMVGKSRDELVGPGISRPLISQILHHGALAWHVRHLASRLSVEPEDLLTLESADLWASCEEKPNRVSWNDFKASAKQLRVDIFDRWGANTVFTIAGPSMIGAGLVMCSPKLDPVESDSVVDTYKIPTYTGFFVHDDEVEKYNKEISAKRYDPVRVNGKTLLVPTSLLTDRPEIEKKICVLDDVIITGHTMNALRDYFRYTVGLRANQYIFGAVVCHESQKFSRSYRPKCNLYKNYENILMPWDRIAEPFEVVVDGHLPSEEIPAPVRSESE